MTPQKLHLYIVRTCLTLHECCICAKNITYGNDYHDGGYGRRAHVTCVANAMRATDVSKLQDPKTASSPDKKEPVAAPDGGTS